MDTFIFYFETELAFRTLVYLFGATVLAFLITFLLPLGGRKEKAEPEHRVVSPHAEAGGSVLRFADGNGSTFFGYLPDKATFFLDLLPGYELSLIQEVLPKEVESIQSQIDVAKNKKVPLEDLKLMTKWGKWQVIQFIEAHVEVVANNHPYIREPEEISLLLAKVVPDQKDGEAAQEEAEEDVIVLVDVISLSGGRGWMHSKAHYWVGRALGPDELVGLKAQLEVYQDREAMEPEPLPIQD